MKLRLTPIIMSIFALGSAGFASSAQAQDSNSYLYIAHAASGRNVSSTANPAFPVDIKMNDTCIVTGESFGDIRGPFSGTAGTFNFVISTANSATPCSNPAIFTAAVSVTAGNTYLGVITLNTANNIVGVTYPINLSAIPAGQARVLVANAALQNLTATLAEDPSGAPEGSLSVPAGHALEGAPPVGLLTTSIWLEGTTTLETGPARVQVEARNMYLYVLAGSATNNSVQLIGPKVIRDVF